MFFNEDLKEKIRDLKLELALLKQEKETAWQKMKADLEADYTHAEHNQAEKWADKTVSSFSSLFKEMAEITKKSLEREEKKIEINNK